MLRSNTQIKNLHSGDKCNVFVDWCRGRDSNSHTIASGGF